MTTDHGPAPTGAIAAALNTLRAYALDMPGAFEAFPWGERVVKVGGKIFVSLNPSAGGMTMGVKLPASSHMALTLPFTEPTHYGLGKHGWVTSRFAAGQDPPVGLLREWIDESYAAVAPRKLADLRQRVVDSMRSDAPATVERPRSSEASDRASAGGAVTSQHGVRNGAQQTAERGSTAKPTAVKKATLAKKRTAKPTPVKKRTAVKPTPVKKATATRAPTPVKKATATRAPTPVKKATATRAPTPVKKAKARTVRAATGEELGGRTARRA